MSQSKVETFLIDFKISYRELDKNMWLVEDAARGLTGVVLMHEDPLVIARVALMKVPAKNREELFHKLLEMNGSDLIHGAYGIDSDEVVLLNSLNYDTMDPGDLETTLDSISLALSQHYPILSQFMDKE